MQLADKGCSFCLFAFVYTRREINNMIAKGKISEQVYEENSLNIILEGGVQGQENGWI